MNDEERGQMTAALHKALQCLHEGCGSPSVRLVGKDIVCMLPGDGLAGVDIIGPISSLEELLGPDWAFGIDKDGPRVPVRLYKFARAWVNVLGKSALTRARIKERAGNEEIVGYVVGGDMEDEEPDDDQIEVVDESWADWGPAPF